MRYVSSAILALVLTSSAIASPITYTVNRSVGTTSVAGTFTTDGNLGVLNAADFLSYFITLVSPTEGTVNISSANPATVLTLTGSALTATASSLSFNFGSSTDSIFDIRTSSQSFNRLNFGIYNLNASALFSAGNSERTFVYSSTVADEYDPQVVFRSSNVIFANVAANGVVPEPATVALVMIGSLAALAGRRYRRRGK